MGTRNLTVVYVDGDYRVAQYGQWDGYPDGQGMTCLEFLTEEFVEHKFRQNLKKIKMVQTQEELEALRTLYKDVLPEFDRDTGAKILELIQNGKVSSGFLVNNIGFASQSDCEWAWVIDLDKRTFEAYVGWNHDPLTEDDRFFFLRDQEEDGYHGAKLVRSWNLSCLPTKEEFLAAFRHDEE